MKNKYVYTTIMLAVILLLSFGIIMLVGGHRGKEQSKDFTVVTSFYPIYIATLNITDGVEGVSLSNLSEPQTGCLHDFQLTPQDMQLLSHADVFVVNGGGIENFMLDVTEKYPDIVIVRATEPVELLMEDDEENAHAWMSVAAYRLMVEQIAKELAKADPKHAPQYEANAKAYDTKLAVLQEEQEAVAKQIASQNVILFHEAYAYVASDYHLGVSMVMDLDEERQVSAGEVADVLRVISTDGVKVILAEELYGSKMGATVEQEEDVTVVYIDTLNRGAYDKDSYIERMRENIKIMQEAFS